MAAFASRCICLPIVSPTCSGVLADLEWAFSQVDDATARVASADSAAAGRAGAFVYIFLFEDVYVNKSVFGQFVSVVVAVASIVVFSQVASFAAAALCASALKYIFCVEGVFSIGDLCHFCSCIYSSQ